MGTAIKHPVLDPVKPSFVIFDILALLRSGLIVRVSGCQKLLIKTAESVALLVARRTNNQKVMGSRPTIVVCITVLTDNRLEWTVCCGRPPLLLPSCRKLWFRLSALMDSDLAWVNGKSGRQSWCYADAFQRSIIRKPFTLFYPYDNSGRLGVKELIT